MKGPYKTAAKLIRLIELTPINTRARVKINNECIEDFKVESRVKQGDPLSAALFTVVVDAILKQLDWRGSLSTCLKECCACADNVVIKNNTVTNWYSLKIEKSINTLN